MHDFEKLEVWNFSIEFSIEIYKKTESFPDKEKFGLISQINRAVVSIPTKIAEGAGRTTPKDFNHFLGIAYGSSCELDTLIIIASKLKYISKEVFDELADKIDKIEKMIYKLQKSLNI